MPILYPPEMLPAPGEGEGAEVIVICPFCGTEKTITHSVWCCDFCKNEPDQQSQEKAS